jgi:hypothetical protein
VHTIGLLAWLLISSTLLLLLRRRQSLLLLSACVCVCVLHCPACYMPHKLVELDAFAAAPGAQGCKSHLRGGV